MHECTSVQFYLDGTGSILIIKPIGMAPISGTVISGTVKDDYHVSTIHGGHICFGPGGTLPGQDCISGGCLFGVCLLPRQATRSRRRD